MTGAYLEVDDFADLYRASPDPWGFRTRWYERRKRALLAASLPAERYRSAYEPGCGNGEFTAVLAPRCDALLAADCDARAVALAASRVRGEPGVRCERHVLPADWPPGPFDLVVLSEIGYYLDDRSLRAMLGALRRSLAPGGTLVACHWRHPVPRHRQDGDSVHAWIAEAMGTRALLRHEEADFLLEAWSHDTRSVAQREGLA